jgi:hypothetical protein
MLQEGSDREEILNGQALNGILIYEFQFHYRHRYRCTFVEPPKNKISILKSSPMQKL